MTKPIKANAGLIKAFDEAMLYIYHIAKVECDYTPSHFFQMLTRLRGVKTAKTLINSAKVSDGYTKLFELDRLDLTVEAEIHDNPKWHGLFTDEELAICKNRLIAYHYFKIESPHP